MRDSAEGHIAHPASPVCRCVLLCSSGEALVSLLLYWTAVHCCVCYLYCRVHTVGVPNRQSGEVGALVCKAMTM